MKTKEKNRIRPVHLNDRQGLPPQKKIIFLKKLHATSKETFSNN